MNYINRLLFILFCVTSTMSFAEKATVSFAEFTKGKIAQQGYFSFYHDKKEGKVYLQIDNFGQEFLFQSSLPHGIGSNDIGLDRGQLGDTRLVKFERVGNKVFLKQLNTYYRADSDNLLEKKSIDEAFASSIIWGFTVVNETVDTRKNTQKVLIDYTPFLLSDIHNISQILKDKKQGNFKVDNSRSALYAKRTKAFPENTELEAMVTFTGSGAGSHLKSVTPDSSSVTVHLHHSLIKLPDDNYQTRAFHPFSGFWSIAYADYASEIDEPLIKRLIPRHRLAKKYSATTGNSVAVEPIVYYLDSGVPEPIRTALIDGAMWWDQAFESIGYKDAFQVKMLPADADPMDVRYNVIQWVHRATRGWSYGASVIDPRTGEIIKGHVTLGSLRVRQDYLIALGLTSPFTAKDTDTSAMKNMALARIRQLSAHEVGHTLGIAHNFAASVNDRASVMDYPHPYITLDEHGEIDLSDAYKENIGLWDKYVIAYGYGDYQNEPEQLLALVADTQAQGLLYASDPDARSSSSTQSTGHLWDNGNNAAIELTRVIQVRKKALSDFGLNSIAVGTPLSELEQTLVPIYNFHRYQVEAAVKLIAGSNYSYELKNDTQKVTEQQGLVTVSAEMQQQALSSLLATLSTDFLTMPASIIQLIPPKAYGYYRNRESFNSQTGITFDPVSAAQASAKHTITLLLNAERLARLAQQESLYFTDSKKGKRQKSAFSVEVLISQLIDKTIKQRPESGLALLVQQRVNQQVIEQLLELWHSPTSVPEVRSATLASLKNIENWLDDNHDDRDYKKLATHFKLLEQQIDFSLSEGKRVVIPTEITMPPGSPIGN
ncbi:zinc-dependent metalloprotease [Colwellia sp. 6_MG-2023]|uniref:zinc-dependent metalloprotease n=1 Tax=Colwellia sp. 6_MG-2023 TaxID=3062676 RepID=UPI0026E480A5|nr:zinc-dependent metalloprotease [Colwellia sp. 6_MG-2023]MDO6487923.1 zinc-dependent metalloprotease [Colwellia sp. 6_MG-2023]